MSLQYFSVKWFLLYYFATGLCLLGGGLYLILQKDAAADYFREAARHEKPPRLPIRILKYYVLFTMPGFVLCFLPFSLTELLFTLWSLLLVYLAGIRLVRWDESRALIKSNSPKLPEIIRGGGAMMVAVGFAIFLLAFSVIRRFPF